MAMELDDRKVTILKAISKTYLETGEPVGSRTISKYSDLKLSSATIRNEMSDLEDMGYIIQPHTSAGRIPSDKGYRFYVDQIELEKDNEVMEFKEMMVQKVDKLELVLRRMAQVLASNTNYAAMISGPSYHKTKLKFIQLSKMEERKLLEYAALAESASSHPISKSLQKAYGKELDRSRVTEVQEISGHGVLAKVDGISVAAGNDKLMARLGIAAVPCHQVGTVIHLAVDGAYAGHILIADVIKPTAKAAMEALRGAGVEKTVMLTGDVRTVAQQVAEELGVDQVFSELLPGDKVAKVEEMLQQKPAKKKLAFVGDGINDAPVLSRADIGIAMGAMGSDAAIEAADVVLMDDDPMKIAKAIRISRKCLRIVYENIAFALGIKGLCLILGALGIANMWLAIFADVGVMILAVLNAIRALFVKRL